MFIIKNNYYLYIENTSDINLNSIKKNNKIIIIYRNNNIEEDTKKIIDLRKKCSQRGFKLYIANNFKLAKQCRAKGLYVSSYNKKIYLNKTLDLIGSAHNFSEI